MALRSGKTPNDTLRSWRQYGRIDATRVHWKSWARMREVSDLQEVRHLQLVLARRSRSCQGFENPAHLPKITLGYARTLIRQEIFVAPTKVGTQGFQSLALLFKPEQDWVPACAGTTSVSVGRIFRLPLSQRTDGIGLARTRSFRGRLFAFPFMVGRCRAVPAPAVVVSDHDHTAAPAG